MFPKKTKPLPKKVKPKKKKLSRSRMIKEADRVASLFIRERDKGKPCITCGASWQDNHQNWHFISRRHLNTRWEERNQNWQCRKCNLWGAWEQYKYWLAIDRLYGAWTANQIMRLANDSSKTSDEEILMYIRYYYGELTKMAVDFKPKKMYLSQ